MGDAADELEERMFLEDEGGVSARNEGAANSGSKACREAYEKWVATDEARRVCGEHGLYAIWQASAEHFRALLSAPALGNVRFAIMNTQAASRLQPYDDEELAQAALLAIRKTLGVE
jgi:hypothetical protein